MLGLFKKKEKTEEENLEENNEEDDSKQKKQETQQAELTGNPSADLAKIIPEIDKLKASVESFSEVRRALTERITGLNEQIGELRAMILDRDRTIQEIELKAVKAADLVESVQPDKLMIEVQKQEAKIEALKANLEGNEAIMERIMEDLKDLRKKLEFFRGIEQIIKLSEEVKKELIEIKKVEATINIQTDKVETIYTELRKKFKDIDVFNDSLQEIKANVEQNAKDINSIKNKITSLADKDELDKLVQKVQRYVDALKEIEKKSSLSKDISQLKEILENIK